MDQEGSSRLIALDAVFSPIPNVKYAVRSARVGQVTDFDRRHPQATTRRNILPEEAVPAAQILKGHMDLFIRRAKRSEAPPPVGCWRPRRPCQPQIEEKLDKSIEELELSVRSFNCLRGCWNQDHPRPGAKSESEIQTP